MLEDEQEWIGGTIHIQGIFLKGAVELIAAQKKIEGKNFVSLILKKKKQIRIKEKYGTRCIVVKLKAQS